MKSRAIFLGGECSPLWGILYLSEMSFVKRVSSLLLCEELVPPNKPRCLTGVSSSSMSSASCGKLWTSWMYFVITRNLSPTLGWKVL